MRAGAASIPPGAGMAELQHGAWEVLIVPISPNHSSDKGCSDLGTGSSVVCS